LELGIAELLIFVKSVGRLDIAKVSISVDSPWLSTSEAMLVGNESNVKDGNMSDIVPEGHKGILLMAHGWVECGQVIVAAVPVALL